VNTFYPYVWNIWSWAYIRWVLGFGIKTGYDRSWTRPARVWIGSMAIVLPRPSNCHNGSSWHLGMYSWSGCYVRQRWDGFYTRVFTIRCTWVSVATSLCAKRLRSPLPEAWSRQCLSVVGCPRAWLTSGPGLGPGSMREAGGVDMWWNHVRSC
jgi:hypothetical protein